MKTYSCKMTKKRPEGTISEKAIIMTNYKAVKPSAF